MMDVQNFLTDLRRYRQMLSEQFCPPEESQSFVGEERAGALRIEYGEMLAAAVCNPSRAVAAEPLIAAAASSSFARMAVVDSAGHHRPVYRALLAYSFIQTFRLL
jgi:hypothetical protein